MDAAQGIEAQTLANVYLALDNDLEILPVINKIDLPSADPERVKEEIEEVIGLDASEAVHASAKAGIGIKEILEQVVQKVPAPTGDPDQPLKALIFDSHYDPYKGVIVYVRVVDGKIKAGSKIKMMATDKVFEVIEVGAFKPRMTIVDELNVGDVGFIVAGIKHVGDTRVGDTVTDANRITSYNVCYTKLLRIHAVIEQLIYCRCCYMNPGIGGSVVNVYFSVLSGDDAVAEYDIGDVANSFLTLRGDKVPTWAMSDFVRLLQIREERIENIS